MRPPGLLQAIMNELQADQRRREALARGFDGLAISLLSDHQPGDDEIGLLCAAVIDAALAGDRELLAVIPKITQRLRHYLPSAEWRSEWEGRLWSLEHLAGLAEDLLEIELKEARAS